MEYIDISYNIETIQNATQLFEIDEKITNLIKGDRMESGTGFGYRDISFEMTSEDKADIDTISEQFEAIMSQYKIDDYGFETSRDEDDGPEYDGAGFRFEDNFEDEAGWEDYSFGV